MGYAMGTMAYPMGYMRPWCLMGCPMGPMAYPLGLMVYPMVFMAYPMGKPMDDLA